MRTLTIDGTPVTAFHVRRTTEVDLEVGPTLTSVEVTVPDPGLAFTDYPAVLDGQPGRLIPIEKNLLHIRFLFAPERDS